MLSMRNFEKQPIIIILVNENVIGSYFIVCHIRFRILTGGYSGYAVELCKIAQKHRRLTRAAAQLSALEKVEKKRQ